MDTIEILYLVKTKTPQIVTLSEPIDEEFMNYVKNEIKLLIKRCEMVDKDPDMKDILFFRNLDSYVS